MDLNEFWKLVDSRVEDPGAADERVKELSEQDLVDLFWLYQDCVDELMEDEYADNFGSSYSEGHHEDVASWVVGKGKAYYDEILDDPEKFPTDFPPLKRDSLQSVAAEVYRDRYGDGIRTRDEDPPDSA